MNTPRYLLPFDQGLLDMPVDRVLVMQPTDTFGLQNLPDLRLEQGFKPLTTSLAHSGYSVDPLVEGEFNLAVVHLTRSKAESLGNIARAARMTHGVVIVDGAKTDGIESVLKQLKKVVSIDGVISKSHGKVFWFGGGSDLPAWEQAASIQKNADGFFTAPGMFSYAKIDKGSAKLTPFFEGLKGRGADFGAGWGWLASKALSAPDITSLDLLEADYHAIKAAEQNISDPRAQFTWCDVTTQPKPKELFDFIISNPPFHQSRKADPDIGKSFIQTAAAQLKPAGRFLMVANRQLPYEATFEQYFKRWTPLYQDGGFKVFEATRPRK